MFAKRMSYCFKALNDPRQTQAFTGSFQDWIEIFSWDSDEENK